MKANNVLNSVLAITAMFLIVSAAANAQVIAPQPTTPPTTLTAATKKAVQGTQQRLQVLGYEPGTADGVMGSRTVTALKKFQSDHGLSVTGVLDQKTLDALSAKEEQKPPTEAAPSKTASPPPKPGGNNVVKARIVMDPMTDSPYYKKLAAGLPFLEDVKKSLLAAHCVVNDDDKEPNDIIINIKPTEVSPYSSDGGHNWAEAKVIGSIYVTHGGNTIAEKEFKGVGYIPIVLRQVPKEGAPFLEAYKESHFDEVAAEVIENALQQLHKH